MDNGKVNLSFPLEIFVKINHTGYMQNKFVVWFNEVGKEDIPLVGGKGANLGEMTQFGIPVPPGFIVTAKAYWHFIEFNKLKPKIEKIFSGLDIFDPLSLARNANAIKRLIYQAKIPKDIAEQIIKSYLELGFFDDAGHKHKNVIKKLKAAISEPLVAVRSSATAEDLPTASFAGQQATFLNIHGEANVVEKVRECWASLFEPRAIFYRQEHNFDHFKVGIAVPVQRMIQSQNSGVMFTIDPVTSDKKKITIEAIYGLGELIVQGTQTPDHYEISKDSNEITKNEPAKQTQMLKKINGKTVEVAVPRNQQEKQKITDGQIKEIARLGEKIEKHYFFPQDIEWAIEDGKIFIVQTRPITTIQGSQTDEQKSEGRSLESALHKLKPLFVGSPASPGIATGPVRLIKSAREISKVLSGEVLVAPQTNPDFVPAMKKAVAIVTDMGGRTSHAAIVSRELGIPCVVGSEKATKVLKNGEVVTVNGGTGEIFKGGVIISGKRPTLIAKMPSIAVPTAVVKTATKLYVNLAEPEEVEKVAEMNIDGVGLLRAEFMMAQIGIHPKKIIQDRKQKMFVNKMSSNLAIFCEHFHDKPVVYRASDFKTNEYRNLIGGKAFEPEESNPMLGYRGCARYISDPASFELELEVIKQVRNKYGYKNLWLMLPFVRTPWELREVKRIIAAAGLVRSPSFKLWMMVEIPSNVILLEEFIKIGIDGVSIGSNDLTMLILGTDRDNSEVANRFNEQDEAVLWALERVIKTCHKQNITASICGQAPSDFPALVEKLVSWGITSISVNHDAINRTREIIYEAEKRRVKSG